MTTRVTRRAFHKFAAGSAVGAFTFPGFVRARGANDRLNVAIIGAGGRGRDNTNGVKSENIVALCDVNRPAVEAAAAKHPEAKHFADFRKLFDEPAKFDAVVVSTCEHTHAAATMLALKHGKHVYCEKPLTHNVHEARLIREAAATAKVATQMGIQMHATDNMRRVVELIQANVIGPVREAHVWVSRSWGLQSEEMAKRHKDVAVTPDFAAGTDPVPAGMDWDLWIGPAAVRPYNNAYLPGPKWYRYWAFGNGTMSDLGSHWNDMAFWALKLRAPLAVSASGPPPHAEIAPAGMTATYEYGPRGDLPAVSLTWYQGEPKPAAFTEKKIPQWGNGVLFVGDKGMLLSDYGKHVLLPEASFKDAKLPEASIPRVPSHYAEWLAACKGGPPALANFEYAGWLTEANHLGNVAYRVGKKLVWDAEKLRATNAPEAEQYLRREYRKGWSL